MTFKSQEDPDIFYHARNVKYSKDIPSDFLLSEGIQPLVAEIKDLFPDAYDVQVDKITLNHDKTFWEFFDTCNEEIQNDLILHWLVHV